MSVAVQPRQRVATLPRLLPPAGADASLGAHIERYGHLPRLRGEGSALISAVEASGLRGRGGAGFPTHLKLAAVAAGRSPIVVANGIEGEPASHKDSLLMRINPHLVLDGAAAAAACVGARTIVIAVNRSATSAHGSLAARDRRARRAGGRARFELVTPPDRFVAGEETALVQWLNGGPAKPAFVPPRPYERGVRGRPTLVQNVETLANIALIARHGPDWFRELGSESEPGSMLVTLGGAVGRPGITELESALPLRAALERCRRFRRSRAGSARRRLLRRLGPARLGTRRTALRGRTATARRLPRSPFAHGPPTRDLRRRRDRAPGRIPRRRERRPVRAVRVRPAMPSPTPSARSPPATAGANDALSACEASRRRSRGAARARTRTGRRASSPAR